MIDRQGSKIIFECDSCSETFESEGEFALAWNAAKQEGWRTRKIADQWLHGCPQCGVPT